MSILALFDGDPGNADACFTIAWLGLWIVGLLYFLLVKPRGVGLILFGVALILVGFIPLGFAFLTP